MSSTPSSDFLALQSALAGRYSIERELGRGGMGVVYLAHEVALDRTVALKVLPPALAGRADQRQRFLREARTAARLSHPHIVPIFTVDEVDGLVFFAMAHVHGESLGERIRRRGPLATSEVVRVLREVAWALAYAHAQGVVHRDVKPDNVLLEEPSGRALVTDFGIARGLDESGSAGREVQGTAEFMSPEQVRGDAMDARSDIYSLGVLGFYGLTGRFPFEADSVPAMLAKHLEEPAPPLASVVPGVPSRLARAIDRCLRKDPGERFPDGEALAEALGQSPESERQIPVALRVFINRNRESYRFGTAGLLLVLFVLLPMIASIVGFSGVGIGSLLTLLVAGGLVSLGPLAVVGYHARKLLKAGYGIDELRLALKQDVDRRDEELTFEFGTAPSKMERVLKSVAYPALGVAGATSLAMLVVPGVALSGGAVGVLTVSGWTGVLTGVAAAHREKRRQDLAGKRWLRFWKSRLGGWLFKAAGLTLTEQPALAAPTYRPTELVIGLSADRLFEQLPREDRRALDGLPQTVRKLEADAQRMRQRVDELDRLLAEIGDESGAAGYAERGKLRGDLTATRDAAEARRKEVLTALETLRLGLLRMQAGAGSVESVTMELTQARGLSADIEGLLAGQQEVERLLRSGEPRTPSTTGA